jgi:hypothetical protein
MGETLRALLMRFGKVQRRIVVVFGFTPADCHAAVLHVRTGEAAIPIGLFSTTPPLPETAILCERVCVRRNPLSMLVQVGVMLWRCWVVFAVATWTGERGRWHLKLAPFLIPPFRTLILNRHGGFFAGTPANVLLHIRRGLLDAIHSGWNRARDITAAILLRWCPFPHRRLFRSWHGSESLDILHPPEDGDGLARVKVDRLFWNGPELDQLVQSTSARWILFQEDGADLHPVDDMLPIAADKDTFAVARQAGFSQWKPQVFLMAPFRTLQPGEASQVLCPISGTILADRRKLAALGIPRTSLTGTAWMLLFWKAAAAGWRSYSIGDGARRSQQPDFPVQERTFVLRTLLDPALRHLGPREPALARGNCAFAPAYLPSARARKECPKVLLVSPFLPYPLSHGGAVRIFNLCRALAGRVDFILVAQRESQDVVDYAKLHEVFREVYVVDRDEPPAADTRLPRQVRDHEPRSLRALITDVCRRSKPDLLQIEYTHMAAFRDAAPGIPAILVEHDLTFTLYHQLAEADPSRTAWREYRRWLEFEQHWLGVYDAVWTVSQEDFAAANL